MNPGFLWNAGVHCFFSPEKPENRVFREAGYLSRFKIELQSVKSENFDVYANVKIC